MLGFLFAFLKNPMTMMTIIAVVATLTALFFISPKTFIKIALDTRTWLAVAMIAMVTGYTHLSKQNTELQAKVEQSQTVTQSKDDATATIRKRAQSKQTRTLERERVRDAISEAAPGQAYDDALDEISELQAEAAPVPAPRQSVVDRLLNRRPDGVVVP